MNPKAKGEVAEAQIVAAYMKAGEVVLLPVGDSQRYDLALDRDGDFIRVQCKTARLRDDIIYIACCNATTATGRVARDYRDGADLFAAYCFENDKTYELPVDSVGTTMVTLRFKPTRNGQKAKVRYAKDYELTSRSQTVTAPL